MSGLDIPALKIFVAAVEEKSLSRAAERQSLVTSAASKRVAEMERHLNRVLLHRHGRGVEPTPAGMLLYHRAKAILRSLQLAEAAVEGYAVDGMAKIRLASVPSPILVMLPPQIGRYLRANPRISVDLLECYSNEIPRMVAEDRADIGIYHGRHPAPGVVSHPYIRDRVGLVVPLGHPLAERKAVHLEDAVDYDLVGYFPRHSFDQFLAYVDQSVSRPPNVRLQVSNFEARCRMVQEGLGLAVLPESIASKYLVDMGLAWLRLEDDWAERQFYICVRHVRDRDKAVDELVEVLREPAR
ncbi:LysR family transcriptional regulator [Bordetella bronchialis]|uniref:LysR family transcriptional regulator n=1 Tax=Bordetella bronchialis TaxID=463025 RepID=A0A193FXH5_9BORD|nr:LysR family transcriptional regulator [Bordetella bronchialis]ANN67245.1 LysR family transcriptional regulator [Bordetella bronchialis]ANN72325.1 LysR family transcriptional regulator [Bordetella bronchialis]